MLKNIRIFRFSPQQHMDPNHVFDQKRSYLIYFQIAETPNLYLMLDNEVISVLELDYANNLMLEGIYRGDLSYRMAPNILYGLLWSIIIKDHKDMVPGDEKYKAFSDIIKKEMPDYVSFCMPGVDGKASNVPMPTNISFITAYSFSPNADIPEYSLGKDMVVVFEFKGSDTDITFTDSKDGKVAAQYKLNPNNSDLMMSAIANGSISEHYVHRYLKDYVERVFIYPIENGGENIPQSALEFNRIWPEYVEHVIGENKKRAAIAKASRDRIIREKKEANSGSEMGESATEEPT